MLEIKCLLFSLADQRNSNALQLCNNFNVWPAVVYASAVDMASSSSRRWTVRSVRYEKLPPSDLFRRSYLSHARYRKTPLTSPGLSMHFSDLWWADRRDLGILPLFVSNFTDGCTKFCKKLMKKIVAWKKKKKKKTHSKEVFWPSGTNSCLPGKCCRCWLVDIFCYACSFEIHLALQVQ